MTGSIPGSPALVGLDWGSSALRAYLLDREGAVLAVRRNDGGASRLAAAAPGATRGAAFEQQLRLLLGDWLVAGRPLLACGMVGSAHGWVEAAYLPCPVDLGRLHQGLAVAPGSGGLELQIVPGVSHRPDGCAPDVMRGEETQVAGVLARLTSAARGEAWIVLPGTHCKWVRVVDGRIVSFATRMTGELFDLLRSHSVLSRSIESGAGFDAAAFARGLGEARTSGGADLTRQLFGVRTLGLFGELPATALGDHLSGLLIGHELASALPEVAPSLPLVLVGDAALCARYRLALQAFGREATVVEDAAAVGLWTVARGAGWV